MSALSSMCRTVTVLVALAAFAVAFAHGAPASTAKSHRKASAAHTARSSSRAHRAVHTQARTRRTRRRSPEEVGRAAGLQIRRQMQLGTAYRHRVTRQTRYRRAHLVQAASVTRRRALQPDSHISDADQPQEAEPASEAKQPEAATQPRALPEPVDEADQSTAPSEKSGPAEDPSPVQASSAEIDSDDQDASLVIPSGAMPPPLRGSLASLERQNERLTAEGLERILDEDDLAARIANHLLVPIPASDALTINPNLTPNHRYCRPWTARFLADLAREHDAIFHRPLEVSSAVRTVAYQKRLMGINGNAAPAEGDIVSPHLTGAAVDITKEGLTRDEMKWMRQRLLEIEQKGEIDVEEEFQQACFHITVYKTYVPSHSRRRPDHATPEQAQPARPAEASAGSDTDGL